jgi:hypothetical protein
MKNIYTLLLTLASTFTFAQQSISFESSEGFQLGTLNQQNGWEVTEGSDGFVTNQVVTNEQASQGTYSFKNAYESDFDFQFFPIFGASKTFDTPADFNNFTISYDIFVTQTQGSDFEFTLFAIDENEEFVPVAGVGIENRGFIYTIKSVDYDFDYAEAEWTPNQWINVKIEVTANQIKYYINDVLQNTVANFTQLNIVGINMLHNNYGADAYYDNFIITTGNLGNKSADGSVFSIYPNPAENSISIVLPANTEIAELSIYNLTGQKVLQSNQSQNINITALASGTYFLKATTTNGAQFTKKIMKK